MTARAVASLLKCRAGASHDRWIDEPGIDKVICEIPDPVAGRNVEFGSNRFDHAVAEENRRILDDLTRSWDERDPDDGVASNFGAPDVVGWRGVLCHGYGDDQR